MRWLAPPDRREITLIIFSLTIFTLSYNLELSILDQGVVFSRLGFGSKLIDRDGRKIPAWQDPLEHQIYGKWAWDQGHIAGDGLERSQEKGVGEFGAMWLGRKEVGDLGGERFGRKGVKEGLRRWGDNVPETKLVRHVPGYSILDNVILFNGTVFLVAEDVTTFPALSAIVSTADSRRNHWEYISRDEAKLKFGDLGGLITGVTWLSTDTAPHNSTLLSLWRTYSTLDPSISASGQTILPPPHRLVFPCNSFFTDPNPPFEEHWRLRRRVDTGFHPFLAKAAFPHLTVMYQEDWEDYHKMEVPYVVERMIVADRGAAAQGLTFGQPIFAPAFETAFEGEVSEHWWEPVRRSLALYLERYEEPVRRTKKVVTYIQRQGESKGDRLRDEDHLELVKALQKMARDYGHEFVMVSSLDEETEWSERMDAVLRSTVIVGVHGDHLLDSVYMRRSPQTTLMEFFPTKFFVRDREQVARSLDFQYIAWWENQKFTTSELPFISPPPNTRTLEISIDAKSVASAVRDALSR